jgi:hypothetical protein
MLQAPLPFYLLAFCRIVFNRPERFKERDHNEVGPLERASYCQYLSGSVKQTLAQWLSDSNMATHQTGIPLHLSHFKTEKHQAL